MLDTNGNTPEKRSLDATAKQPAPENDYPEGGWKAWSVVVGAWCAMIPCMGILNALGVLHAWLSTHQLKEYSESSVGWIFGAYGFFLYLAGAQAGMFRLKEEGSEEMLRKNQITGPIFDAYGPNYIVIPGSVGMVVSLICFSFSEGVLPSIVFDTFQRVTDCPRILSDLFILQRPRRSLRLHLIHPIGLRHRPLVQHPSRLRNRDRMHSRWNRGRDIPIDHPLRRSSNWLRMVHSHCRSHMRLHVYIRVSPPQDQVTWKH